MTSQLEAHAETVVAGTGGPDVAADKGHAVLICSELPRNLDAGIPASKLRGSIIEGLA